MAKKRNEKQKRIDADEARQIRNGPDVPPTVNNFLNNIPTACKPKNDEMVRALRDVQAVHQVVNGKVADSNLIHKSGSIANEQKFFPVIDDGLIAKKDKHGKR